MEHTLTTVVDCDVVNSHFKLETIRNLVIYEDLFLAVNR